MRVGSGVLFCEGQTRKAIGEVTWVIESLNKPLPVTKRKQSTDPPLSLFHGIVDTVEIIVRPD